MSETVAASALLTLALPAEVVDVFKHFFTAELTTLGREGMPVTWPIMPIFWERRGLFITATSIGLPQKAFNIRRNPRVALLFSEPTGSGLTDPPAVLVQGEAVAPDRLFTSRRDADPELFNFMTFQARKMLQRQPSMSFYMSSPMTRYLMDWYFMRVLITITPRRILWWEGGDFSRPPEHVEVSHVG
jgi:hypothetical protein